MSKFKKLCCIMVASILLSTLLSINTIAISDVTPPQLNSISIDKTQVTAPGSVMVTADITDDCSGVNYIQICYSCPKTQKSIGFELQYNPASGKYTGTLSLDEFSEAGIYSLTVISLMDTSRNYVSLYPDDVPFDINFTVINDNANDVKPPQLNSISIDKTQVTAPGSVRVTADITDDYSGVDTISIEYSSPITNKKIDFTLIYDPTSSKYIGIISLDEYSEAGIYTLDHIFLSDKSNNVVFLNSADIPFDISFTVSNDNINDVTPPQLNNISIDTTQVTTPGSVTVTADVTDDYSGVYAVNIYYNRPINNNIALTLKYDTASGKYIGTISLNEFSQSGIYTLDYIYLLDNSGNQISLQPADIPFDINFTVMATNLDKVLDKSLTFHGDYVSGFKVGSHIEDYYTGDYKVVVYASDGTTAVTDNALATGNIIKLYDKDDACVDTATVVIKGDVNGDGKVDTLDYISVRLHLLGISNVEEAYFDAANINGDTGVNTLDYIALRLYLLGISELN
jgi:hypothetical protein